MKPFLVILALAAVLAAGCAGHQTDGVDRDTLLDCRSKADEMHKARYGDDWEAAVRQCLKERAD